MERLLLGTSYHLTRFTTSIADWTRIESGPLPLEITFARFFTANVYYGHFGELQKRPPPALRITTGSVITIHYSKYGKLLEGLEDQLILDNDEIAGDTREAGKAEDEEDKEAGKGNDGAVDGGDQEDGEVGKAGDGGDKKVGKAGDGGDQETGKAGDGGD